MKNLLACLLEFALLLLLKPRMLLPSLVSHHHRGLSVWGLHKKFAARWMLRARQGVLLHDSIVNIRLAIIRIPVNLPSSSKCDRLPRLAPR